MFTTNKIQDADEVISQELRNARTAKQLSLAAAAQRSGIPERYLGALESGHFEDLPAGVYGRNFLREYALFLGLNAETLLELFRGQGNAAPIHGNSGVFERKVPPWRYFLAMPKIVRNTIIAAAVIICMAYLGYYTYNITAPPELSLYYPANDLTLSQTTITLKGKVEPETDVTINDEPVLTDAVGYFSQAVNLKQGLNTITVTARKKHSRINLIERKILVELPDLLIPANP